MAGLDGRVALITGSGRGIGQQLAFRLAREGARVVVNDLDEAVAQETASQIKSDGGTAVVCAGNVTAPEFAARFVATAVDGFGGLDILVNNAGYTWDSVIQKMTDDQFQAMLDVHLTAPFRILRVAVGPIRDFAKREAEQGVRRHRKVVNVSSTSGWFGLAGQVNYAAGKAGIIGMTKTLAKEWGRYHVNVNAVAFGMIETRLTQPLDNAGASIDIDGRKVAVGVQRERIASAAAQFALGRAGTAEEAAGALYFFCSADSNYVTGQLLLCDGGR